MGAVRPRVQEAVMAMGGFPKRRDVVECELEPVLVDHTEEGLRAAHVTGPQVAVRLACGHRRLLPKPVPTKATCARC
jgi:hypothetical protein